MFCRTCQRDVALVEHLCKPRPDHRAGERDLLPAAITQPCPRCDNGTVILEHDYDGQGQYQPLVDECDLCGGSGWIDIHPHPSTRGERDDD